MDPDKTLRLAREALRAGRAREAAEHYAILAAWAYCDDTEWN